MFGFSRVALCFLYLFGNVCFSQTLFSNVKYQVEAGTYLSTSGVVPFWLRSNQYGIVPLHSPILTFRGSAHKEYDSTENNNQKLKKFDIGYGLGVVANIGKLSGFLLPEAYLKVRYGAFEFYGGRRREIMGLVDTTLSSGSYIWSGNALPVPKLQVSIPNYTSIIGHGLVSIKGGYAHGWFGNQGIIKDYYLHQKWLYGRIGKPDWKMKFYAGFNHQVQWGGYTSIPFKKGSGVNNIYPATLQSYLYILTGQSLNLVTNLNSTTFSELDEGNRVGNHLGSIDMMTEFQTKVGLIKVYRQSIYEDGSLFYLINIKDGLTGIALKNNNKRHNAFLQLQGINVEYLETRSQGGRVISAATFNIPYLRGNDNYFNHGQFLDGYSYHNYTVGTPFITPTNTLQEGLPETIISNLESNETYYTFTPNNRVSAISLSTAIVIANRLNLKLQYSNSINLGTYNVPFGKLKNQNSYLLNLTIPNIYKNSSVIFNMAQDFGGLFKPSSGVYVGLKTSY